MCKSNDSKLRSSEFYHPKLLITFAVKMNFLALGNICIAGRCPVHCGRHHHRSTFLWPGGTRHIILFKTSNLTTSLKLGMVTKSMIFLNCSW